MKKIYSLLMIIAAIGFTACEGPEGPPGIDGMDGKDGVDGEEGGLFLSTVFEAEVNFTADDGYQVRYNLDLYESDNLLIYIALGVDEEKDIIWMPLPQTFFIEKGMVIYNYFFSKKKFSIFLDSTVPPEDLEAEWTDNQVFRIVVVPGEFYQEAASRIDFSDYQAVMKWLGKGEKDIEKIILK